MVKVHNYEKHCKFFFTMTVSFKNGIVKYVINEVEVMKMEKLKIAWRARQTVER